MIQMYPENTFINHCMDILAVRYGDICWTRISFYRLLNTLMGFYVIIYVDSTSKMQKKSKVVGQSG